MTAAQLPLDLTPRPRKGGVTVAPLTWVVIAVDEHGHGHGQDATPC